MLQRLSIAAFVLGLSLTLPVPAHAQFTADRPSLPDGWWYTWTDTGDKTTGRGWGAGVMLSDSPSIVGYALMHGRAEYGAVNFYGWSSKGSAEVTWFIYEPDLVKRSSKGVKLKQKDYVAFRVQLQASGTISTSLPGQYIVVEGCKAQAAAKGTELAYENTVNQVQAKLKCDDLLGPDGLDLNPTQQAALKGLFAVEELNEGLLSVKGKGAVFSPDHIYGP